MPPARTGAAETTTAARWADRADGATGPNGRFESPVVVGGIKGGLHGGTIEETQSRTGTPRRTIALIGFLVVLVIAQKLDAAGRDGSPGGILAFSDGEKPDGMPSLLPRPIAFFLFTLVAGPDAGVQDLTLDQIRSIYAGKVVNWREIGGNDLPIRLVSRNPGSGTRAAFQRRVHLRRAGRRVAGRELPALPDQPGGRRHHPGARRPALRRPGQPGDLPPDVNRSCEAVSEPG